MLVSLTVQWPRSCSLGSKRPLVCLFLVLNIVGGEAPVPKRGEVACGERGSRTAPSPKQPLIGKLTSSKPTNAIFDPLRM